MAGVMNDINGIPKSNVTSLLYSKCSPGEWNISESSVSDLTHKDQSWKKNVCIVGVPKL